VCRRYQSWYGNVNYDLESNGEGAVLDTVARFAPRVIFDVGANVGDWSQAAASRCSTAALHAFEISPPTFERLRENTRHTPGVVAPLRWRAGAHDRQRLSASAAVRIHRRADTSRR
jgi:hypothetical protein